MKKEQTIRKMNRRVHRHTQQYLKHHDRVPTEFIMVEMALDWILENKSSCTPLKVLEGIG